MKLMFGVESVNDHAAYRGLIGAILGRRIEAGEVRILRPHQPEAAAIVVRQAHRLGLAGVVLALDNDGVEPLHEGHEPPTNTSCRHCLLLKAAQADGVRTWPRPALPRLGIVFGVPVQTIETWLLLASRHPFAGHPHSIGRRSAERRLLKRWLYGMERPTLEVMQKVTADVTANMNLEALASASRSFAHFSDQVRAELSPP